MSAKNRIFTQLAAQIHGAITGKPTEERLKAGLCPMCGGKADIDEFRDKTSRDEFALSGICQTCQDQIFASPDGE